MRRLSNAGDGAPRPALSSESKAWAKYPLMREFVTKTTYDDGSPRTPGDVGLRNRGHIFELTARDPDSGLRLPVCAQTLDEVFFALESLLGAENAPWVCDEYLTAQLAKKKKK